MNDDIKTTTPEGAVMTTLYRPVLIESAEQAEALPLFTIATIEDSPVTGYPEVARKIVNGWRNRDLVDGRIPHADMIGWTALVPIEAEEEHGARGDGEAEDFYLVRRYVTSWEKA